MNLFLLCILGATALFLTFSLGYLTLRAFTELTDKACLALAGACGMALQGAVAFIGFLLNISGRTFSLLTITGLFMIALAFLLRSSRENVPLQIGPGLYPLAFFWLSALGIQLIVPIYSGAFGYGDWWMHYDLSKVFLGERAVDTIYFNRYTVISRTPLFNLFSAYYLGLFGDQFSVYQLTSILPGFFVLATVPLFMSAQRAAVAIVLLALNAYINNMTTYPWPKMLAALYVIISIYFYLDVRKDSRPDLRSRSAMGCGAGWALAILSHPSAVLYVAAMIADCIWINRFNLLKTFRQLLISAFIAAGVLFPWVFWGVCKYGIAQLLGALTKGTGHAAGAQRLIDAALNAFYTLVPLPLFNAFLKAQRGSPLFGTIGNPWLRFYYAILPGALTVTMSGLLLFGGVARWVKKRVLQSILPGPLFFTIVVIGFFGGCLLQPGFGFHRIGIAGESMLPLVFFLLLVAADYLCSLPVRLRQLLLLMVAGEFMISRGLHLVLLLLGHPFVWDANAKLKIENSLIFARDIIGNGWQPGMVMMVLFISFVLLLMVGLKTCSSRYDLSGINKKACA